MAAVVDYRQRLAALQGGWDSLALLTHFGDGGADLGNTRQAFDSLASDLVTHLSNETHKKAAVAAEARAQVAIDILVRNLFERTADVGFLAADDDLKRFAREASSLRRQSEETDSARVELDSLTRQMQRRLAEYVAKYSVYSNVVLVSPDREVLVQLEGGSAAAVIRDELISRALAAGSSYVETFAASDLVPGERRSLIYSQRVADGNEVLGVLCLCFALEDECAGIFERLVGAQDWTVLALLDERHEVIASSDTLQLPVGVRVRPCDQAAGIMRFAGREYLAIARGAKPYQGYAGPPWRGHVMVPLEHAFASSTRAGTGNTGALAGARLDSAAFSADLLAVPRHAEAVQRDLSRSVWNGNVRLSTDDTANSNFARALLREVGKLGRRTQEVFERSIEDLQETVVSAVLHDSGFLASLAIEQFARNLYERANDCRWWALNDTLIGALAGGRDAISATEVLRHINSLYTVYHGIVLFDDARRVVAVSRADLEHRLGSVIDEPWASRTLALRDSQSYSVSDFNGSSFYEDRPTLIYGAAMRSAAGKVIGGVAVVFDSAPQFSAMLQDILPRDPHGQLLAGCVAMFLDRDLRVIAATDKVAADLACRKLDVAATVDSAVAVRMGDTCYALGTKLESGYREYAGIGARAAVLIPLGTAAAAATATRSAMPNSARLSAEGGKPELLRYTTFAVGSNWYALPTAQVIEAIDAKSLQPVAGASPCWAGVMFYGNDAVPVAELACLTGAESLEPPTVVILVRVPGRAQPLGLLVEALGDNFDVPAHRLLPVRAGGVKAPLVDQSIQFETEGEALVMVLNLDGVAGSLYGGDQQSRPKRLIA